METFSQLIRGFAASHALLPELAHLPLDGATCQRHTLAVDLGPDLLGAIGLVVGLPNALHMRQQLRTALGSQRAQLDCADTRRSAGTPMGQIVGRRGSTRRQAAGGADR